jgi:hypothetical protein
VLKCAKWSPRRKDDRRAGPEALTAYGKLGCEGASIQKRGRVAVSGTRRLSPGEREKPPGFPLVAKSTNFGRNG